MQTFPFQETRKAGSLAKPIIQFNPLCSQAYSALTQIEKKKMDKNGVIIFVRQILCNALSLDQSTQKYTSIGKEAKLNKND